VAPLALVALLTLAGTLPDRGIFPELLARIRLAPPPTIAAAGAWLRIDRRHQLATLYDGDDPVALFALAGGELDAADRAQLTALAGGLPRMVAAAPSRGEDRDGDGIVDRLDVLLGAKKLVVNGARYLERYVALTYPDGDVPRTEGVCSDTVIRALRNAGLDLQRELHEDLARAPAAYPMVERVDASINHRRVRTLLPWFVRHWRSLPRGSRYRPGDVVFFDTFPARPGPDHLGVVSDRDGPSGLPMVVNNWAEGASDAELDLLSWVPVTHHFRWPSPSGAGGGSSAGGGSDHAAASRR
jgi:uncharacterized protein YijF (DUF1287 family)